MRFIRFFGISSAFMKRLRYADVYHGAFLSGCVSTYVGRVVKRFRRDPVRMVHVPRYLQTMLRTQTIAHHGGRAAPTDALAWALALARLVERRAARTLTRHAIDFLYRPAGPWLRRTLLEYERSGLDAF